MTQIDNIMQDISKMKREESLEYYDFGRNGNVHLLIVKDEEGDIRYFEEPWDEQAECYVTDWDGSEWYMVEDNPNDLETLRKALENDWEDSGEWILNDL